MPDDLPISPTRISAVIPASTYEALLSFLADQSALVSAEDGSALRLAALVLRTAKRSGYQVFIAM